MDTGEHSGGGGHARRQGGRPRSGAELLSPELILDAAYALVEAEGFEALTMRRLAAALDVNPMSIYHHLPGKRAVVAGLVDRVFSTMALPDSTEGPWEDRVRGWAHAYRDLARAHPELVLPLVADVSAASRAVLLVCDPLYQALLDARLAPADVVCSADTLVDLVHGFTLAEAAQGHEPFDRRTLLGGLGDSTATPAMHAVFSALSAEEARYDFDAGFVRGLDLLMAGIRSRVPRG